MYRMLAAGALTLVLSGIAGAHGSYNPPSWHEPWTPGPTFRAPEIDPASAGAAVTLLLGSLIVLRGRKTIK